MLVWFGLVWFGWCRTLLLLRFPTAVTAVTVTVISMRRNFAQYNFDRGFRLRLLLTVNAIATYFEFLLTVTPIVT